MSKIQLKPHNQHTYNKIKEAFEDTNMVGVVQATGTGKSYIIAKVIENMNFKKVLFLSPSLYIINSFKESFPSLEDKIFFMTYKKLMYIKDIERFFKENNFDLIVMDEYHRCGGKVWGINVKKLIDFYKKDTKIIGTTATPIRYLDNARDMTEELFGSQPINELSLPEAIKSGILPKPKYIVSYYDVKDEIVQLKSKFENNKLIHAEDKEKILSNIQYILNNLNKLVNIEDVLSKNITKERKFIVFCSNIKHAQEMSKIVPLWFKNIGYKPNVYTVYTNEGAISLEKNEIALENFKCSHTSDNKVSLLFCINILNEGIHIEDVDGLIFLRNTTSPIIYLQQLGRALASGNSRVPLVFDLVNNIDGLNFVGTSLDLDRYENKNYVPKNIIKDYSMQGFIEISDNTLDLSRELSKINVLASGWDRFVSELKAYKNENGHCYIPSNHILYKRCNTIRTIYKNGRLESYKEEALRELDFDFNKSGFKEDSWIKMFNLLKEFKLKYGHCDIPTNYSENKKLGEWVKTQRKNKDILSESRKNALLSLGFNFEFAKTKNEEDWERMFKELLKFKVTFKHVNVSSRFKDKTLANWVRSQRKAFKSGKLSKYRYDKLIEIGFDFKVA